MPRFHVAMSLIMIPVWVSQTIVRGDMHILDLDMEMSMDKNVEGDN